MDPTTHEARRGLLAVYAPADPVFVRGEGSELVDEEGRRYLDFTSGIAVNALGYGDAGVREAIRTWLERGVIHTSNLFRTRPAEDLALRLTELAGLDRAFFCNSGAEATEGALKFARRWAREHGGPGKHRVVALRGSFHGRLFGSLAVTDRPAYREPFEPLVPGVDFVDPDDPDGLDAALDPARTAALIAEPIQGEGGVRPLSHETLRRMRERTRARGIALILDEIQCGLGRTGELFAHQAAGIRPDLLLLAKPLAGGLPMGAILLAKEVAEAIRPGDHATTFGGGPLVAAAARAVVERVSDAAFLSEVRAKGDRLEALLVELRDRRPETVLEVRGRGLMRGLRVADNAGEVVGRARGAGLLLATAGPDVVRFLPPLTVTDEELERGVAVVAESLSAREPGEPTGASRGGRPPGEGPVGTSR
jgi:acetylornithine/N-succinyldiaminopimelate aminotransferase